MEPAQWQHLTRSLSLRQLSYAHLRNQNRWQAFDMVQKAVAGQGDFQGVPGAVVGVGERLGQCLAVVGEMILHRVRHIQDDFANDSTDRRANSLSEAKTGQIAGEPCRDKCSRRIGSSYAKGRSELMNPFTILPRRGASDFGTHAADLAGRTFGWCFQRLCSQKYCSGWRWTMRSRASV